MRHLTKWFKSYRLHIWFKNIKPKTERRIFLRQSCQSGAALMVVLLAGAGLFLWTGNSGAGKTEEITGAEGSTEASISDDVEAEDYQITGILTGAYGICSYDSSYVNKESLSELLWLVPRRYDIVDGTDYMDVIAGIDRLKESWDETSSYVTYTEDIPVFVRYYMESYVAPDGVNAIDHKDIVLLREGNDMVVCIQKPDEESEWLFYLAPDYGDWLLKEVELRYRISFPELFPETSDSEQEGNDAVEITAPQKAEVMAMREVVLDGMSENEAETLCSLIKEANTKMESLILYNNFFSNLSDPENLYWNYFDESGEIQIGWATGDDDQTIQEIMSNEGLTETEYYEKYGNKVVTENTYSAGEFAQLLEEIRASVSNEALNNDLQQVIEEAKLAAETHDVEHAEKLYYLVHDMDYFLLNYRLDTEGQYIRDKSTISQYYGVLSVYG